MLSLTFTSNKPLTSNNTQPQNIFIQINPGGLFTKYDTFKKINHFVLTISLHLTKSSEVRIPGDCTAIHKHLWSCTIFTFF